MFSRQNSTARIVTGTRRIGHFTPGRLTRLHQQKIAKRIEYNNYSCPDNAQVRQNLSAQLQ